MNVLLSEILNNKIEGISNKNNTIFISKDLSLTIDFDIFIEEFNLVVENAIIDILEINPTYKKINIEVKQNASFKHCSILNAFSNFEESTLYCNNYGTYNRFLIDLSNKTNNLNCKIDLNGEGSESNYKSSIVSPDKTIKKHVTHIVNNARHTIGNILNYGIVFGDATLDITGIGDIKNGASVSDARQKTTIVTFDEKSKGYARPFLFIGEDDVKASHDTAVGKIDEDILFYMCSRGLSANEAKRFISLGYFKPIINDLNDEKVEKDIIEYLEGVIK